MLPQFENGLIERNSKIREIICCMKEIHCKCSGNTNSYALQLLV